MTVLLKSYLQPMLKKGIDYLVLGCTHYPYLIPQIKEILGNNVTIIDSGEAVAKQTKSILEQHQLINLNRKMKFHQFYINKNKKVLKTILKNYKSARIDELNF